MHIQVIADVPRDIMYALGPGAVWTDREAEAAAPRASAQDVEREPAYMYACVARRGGRRRAGSAHPVVNPRHMDSLNRVAAAGANWCQWF